MMRTNYYQFWYKELRKKLVLCEHCNEKRALFVHHVNKIREDNRNINLKLLCRKCHADIHSQGIDTFDDVTCNINHKIDLCLYNFSRLKTQLEHSHQRKDMQYNILKLIEIKNMIGEI